MTLESKGPIVAPPLLSGTAQGGSLAVQAWPRVISATHWHLYSHTQPDGADFYVGPEELGHIHLDGDIHVPTGLPLRQALLARGLAKAFPYGAKEEGWISFVIRTDADASHAQWLFQLNYDRLNGTPLAKLLESIQAKG